MNPEYAHIGAADDKLIEEMAELTKELCKVKRFGMSDRNRENIILEIGDWKSYIRNLQQISLSLKISICLPILIQMSLLIKHRTLLPFSTVTFLT